MADDVATVSSRPAFGFVAVVMMMRSYSRGSACRSTRRLVDQPDDRPEERPLDQRGHSHLRAEPNPDVERRVVHTDEGGDDEDANQQSEAHPFGDAAATLVTLGVDVRRGEQADEETGEHPRQVGGARVRGPI